MKNTQSNLDSDYNNMHHIARKRKTEAVRSTQEAKNYRDKQNLVEEMDTEEYGYEPEDYARYIK